MNYLGVFCIIGFMLSVINILISVITMFKIEKNIKFVIISILGCLVGLFPYILNYLTKPTIPDMTLDEMMSNTLSISIIICEIMNFIIQLIIFVNIIENIHKNIKKEEP